MPVGALDGGGPAVCRATGCAYRSAELNRETDTGTFALYCVFQLIYLESNTAR